MLGVCEGEDHLIDNSIHPNRPTDQLGVGIGWIIGDEEVLVETMKIFLTNTASQGRDVVDVAWSNVSCCQYSFGESHTARRP